MNEKKELSKKRYVSVSYRGIKGIRQDTKNQNFLVVKTIRGKRYSATFKTAREAADWKRDFHPSLNFEPSERNLQSMASKTLRELNLKKRPVSKKNGEDFGYTIGDAWTMYIERHLSKLEFSSYEHRMDRGRNFLKRIMNTPMVGVNADLISEHLAIEREEAPKNKLSRRYNFNDDLKILKSFLNWYRENIDPMFVNPVLKRHKREGIVRELVKKKKKMRTP